MNQQIQVNPGAKTVLNRQVAITWLGHATFSIATPGGKTVLIDPWIEGNPACPESLKKVEQVDLMLITHGHFDHIADAVTIGRRLNPKVVAAFETCLWLESKQVANTMPMNKGGTQTIDGIKITMVHADHSCGIQDGGAVVYGGDPCGYVVELENGFKFYHAGDTNVFGDMKLIHELYDPDLAMLPIGDVYTMSPREAAYACRLLQARYVIPMHFGTFPVLTGTPAQLRDLTGALSGTGIIELLPGETLT